MPMNQSTKKERMSVACREKVIKMDKKINNRNGKASSTRATELETNK